MFGCTECGYTFALSTSLLEHMLLHSVYEFHSKERQSCLTNIPHKLNANNVSYNCQLILAIQLLASLRLQTIFVNSE